MKKNMMEKLSSLLLAAVMVLGVSVTAFAADPETITFKGKDNFEVTSDDLFSNFKNVMPGDALTQQVVFENKARDCDYIQVYLKAVPRTFVSQKSENLLSKLTLTVKNGSSEIYEAAPNETGTLTNGVYLGRLRNGQKVTLDLTLEVPIELTGEELEGVTAQAVDWVFIASGMEDETTPGGGGGGETDTDDNNGGDFPRINLKTIEDDDVPLADLPGDTVTIDDDEVPLKDIPDTGDMIPVTAMAAAAISLCGIIALNRKKKNDQDK